MQLPGFFANEKGNTARRINDREKIQLAQNMDISTVDDYLSRKINDIRLGRKNSRLNQHHDTVRRVRIFQKELLKESESSNANASKMMGHIENDRPIETAAHSSFSI